MGGFEATLPAPGRGRGVLTGSSRATQRCYTGVTLGRGRETPKPVKITHSGHVTVASFNNPRWVIVEGPAEFWDWFVGLDDAARQGDEVARERHDLALALLLDLHDSRFAPARDQRSGVLARVRHAHRHPVWRLVGRGESGAEVRFHCAFPVGTQVALITSTSGNLARIGDLFPRVVMARTELLVEHWLRARARGSQGESCGLTRGFASGDEPFVEALARRGVAERILGLRDQLHRTAVGRHRARPVVRPPQVTPAASAPGDAEGGPGHQVSRTPLPHRVPRLSVTP